VVSAEEDRIAGALRAVRLRFRYDWRLFQVQQLESPLPFRWQELAAGELVLEASSADGFPASGELFRLSGRALWHPQMQTPLELRVDSVESRIPLELVVQPGILHVDSACLAWERRFGTGKATTLWLEEPGECPRLIVELGSDEEVELRLTDLRGREVFAWRADPAQSGRRVELRVPCTQLASGVYGAVLRQGSVRRSLWFLLLR
jgi:hypothetical protein